MESYNYDRIISDKIPNYTWDYVYRYTKEEENKNFDTSRYYAIISFICTSDTQCLTNKCIDGYCMFNIENSTEFCIYIYIIQFLYHLYIHCGNVVGEICKTNKECASVKCLRNGYCYAPPNRPSDSDGIYDIFEFFVYFCTLYSNFYIY